MNYNIKDLHCARQITVIFLLAVIAITIASFFWYNEWIYSLPTPVPNGYKVVQVGQRVNLPAGLSPGSKPVFFHFFNPDCPCSRFNIPHFKSLVKEYGSTVDFVIVPVSYRPVTREEINKKFELDIPVLFEPTLAQAVGVYSTPQAVIVDTNGSLYFRGNYNRSRYCADKKTEYARLAIASLVSHQGPIKFDRFALKAYGCQTPQCTKR